MSKITSNAWLEALKEVALSARDLNEGQRLGQYLFNIIRSSKDFPKTKNVEEEEYEVGRILWNIEASELLVMIEDFQKSTQLKHRSYPQLNT